MERLINTAVTKVGIPMADAVRMASETPAHIMREDNHKGSLRKNFDADIVIYDSNVRLQFVMQMGHIVRNDLVKK